MFTFHSLRGGGASQPTDQKAMARREVRRLQHYRPAASCDGRAVFGKSRTRHSGGEMVASFLRRRQPSALGLIRNRHNSRRRWHRYQGVDHTGPGKCSGQDKPGEYATEKTGIDDEKGHYMLRSPITHLSGLPKTTPPPRFAPAFSSFSM